MATGKQALDKLSGRIDELSALLGFRPKLVVIEVPQVMNENAVLERHYRRYPRDRLAELTVTIRRFGGADPDEYREDEDPKISRAWRELAREQKQAQPLGFWAAPSENSLMRRS